jgi:hypothetical protein
MKLKQIDFNAELIGQDGIVVKTMDGRDVKQLTYFKCDDPFPLGDMCYLELENSTLWVADAEIWQVFEVEFGMNYGKIQSFIKDQVEQHFKMTGVTPGLGIVFYVK